MKTICSFCNQAIQGELVFCPKCGNKLDYKDKNISKSPVKPEKQSKWGTAFLIIVGGFMTALVVYVLLFTGNNQGQHSTNEAFADLLFLVISIPVGMILMGIFIWIGKWAKQFESTKK